MPAQARLSWKKAILLNTIFWIAVWGIALWNNFQWAAVVDRALTLETVFSWSFPYYLTMVIIGPVVYLLLIRWGEFSYLKQVRLHLLPSIIAGFVHQLSMNAFAILFGDNQAQSEVSFPEELFLRYESGMVFSSNGLLFYWLVVGLFYSLTLYQKYRHEEINNLHLKSDLNLARLQSLQMQLQPHFLFNSFNTISMMARKNKTNEVVEIVGSLGELLHESLALKDTQMLTLTKELELTQKYLHIQQVRFSDRLTIRIDIPEDALAMKVPSLLFQPIVENAFQHGIEKASGQVTFRIGAKLENDFMTFTFFNDGDLLPKDFDINCQAGFGLSTTLSRLDHTYGKDYAFDLRNADDQTGVIAVLTLPITH